LQGFVETRLDDGCSFFVGALPPELRLDDERFEALWGLHPVDYHEIQIHGRLVKTPRWQQAYGVSYRYSGRVNRALPTPELIRPALNWVRQAVDPRLNAALLNWYDGRLAHYIGKHRDDTTNMVEGAPIVMLSYGERRSFRLRPWRGKGFTDFPASDGTVFVLPYATNLAWTHEVPASKRLQGRRISVSLRALRDRSR
jgi:alkylated DNA repair dioxygenase AlkB